MSRRQTLLIAALTAAYLCFELGFNARLLDAVGSDISADQLHAIEVYGRTLSGIAVALVVIQVLLARRKPYDFHWTATVLLPSALAGLATYGFLQVLVDGVTEQSSSEFRRASMSTVLVQRALLHGGVQLDGIDERSGLFAEPAGKVFLALFPLMATSIERLNDKLSNAKLGMLTNEVAAKRGGPMAVHDQYRRLVDEMQTKWQHYRGVFREDELLLESRNASREAWRKYEKDLELRRWRPQTIPGYAKAAVVRETRRHIPVAADWNPADQTSFMRAVEYQARSRLQAGQSQLVFGNRTVEPGLDWPSFFGHLVIQQELKKQMGLPSSMTLQRDYKSQQVFRREVADTVFVEAARQKLPVYNAPAVSFGDGMKNAQVGVDNARTVIVPALALFFSLMGAVGHLAKLTYLLLRLTATSFSTDGVLLRWLWVAPVTVLFGVWVYLSDTNNEVTESRLFNYMSHQMLQAADGLGPKLSTKLLLNGLHAVAIGQSIGYPLNERVRMSVLGGFDFGYVPNTRSDVTAPRQR